LNVIGTMEKLGIDRNEWTCQLLLRSPQNPNEKTREELKSWWANILRIKKENIVSVEWRKGDGKEHGSIRIFITNAVLFEIFVNGMLKWVKENILVLDESGLSHILKGIIASEGSLNVNKDMLQGVELACDGKSEEPFLFRLVLWKLGISTNNTKILASISITGLVNLCLLSMFREFSIHETKNKRFLELLANKLK